MTVLAFDTCLEAVSVAVRWRTPAGDWRVEELAEARRTGHAERLMPMIGEVLAAARLEMPAIDRFAVTTGPGTFTGVRVGVAAARALALATNRPVVTMTSLAVIAHGVDPASSPESCLAVAVDARQGLVYGQLFDAARAPLGAPRLIAPADFAREVGARSVVIAGSGAEVLAAAVTAAGGIVEAVLPGRVPSAAVLARLAPDLAPVHPVRPLYLRAPDVKPQDGAVLARSLPG